MAQDERGRASEESRQRPPVSPDGSSRDEGMKGIRKTKIPEQFFPAPLRPNDIKRHYDPRRQQKAGAENESPGRPVRSAAAVSLIWRHWLLGPSKAHSAHMRLKVARVAVPLVVAAHSSFIP